MRVTLSGEQVRALFASCSNNYDVLIGLYKLALPNWDKIEYILDGKPHIGEKGWRIIYDLFLEFDKEYHGNEDIVPGIMWLGQGFTADERLGDLEVDISAMKLILKPES